MKEIKDKIEKEYELKVKNIYQYRDGFIIDTSKGKKLVKRSCISTHRITFIHNAKEYIYNKGFENLDRFLCTREGLSYFLFSDCMYTIADFIEGRECDFDNRDDIINASRMLANMHKASKGYLPSSSIKCDDNLGKIPFYFNKRLEEIKKLRKVAERERKKFDYLFLQHFDYFYKMGEASINQIYVSKYMDLVQKAKQEGSLCHHDFSYQNIICNDQSIALINFDYCSLELKIYDIANFLRRKMRKSNWDIKQAKLILDNYRKIEPLSNDEIYVMKIMLQFPQKFWRVLNRYYNSKRSWAQKNYINRLNEVISEIDYHSNFLKKFDSIV